MSSAAGNGHDLDVRVAVIESQARRRDTEIANLGAGLRELTDLTDRRADQVIKQLTAHGDALVELQASLVRLGKALEEMRSALAESQKRRGPRRVTKAGAL